MDITLEWQGPYRLISTERFNFKPPTEPGLYMWTVTPEHKISYIGIASKNIRKRLKEHVIGMVSGEYWLPSDGHLDRGEDPWKKPTHKSLENGDDLAYFTCEWPLIQAAALKNLQKLSFFWATHHAEERMLKSIESGLLSEARKNGAPLQNGGVSLVSQNAPRVSITNQAPSVGIAGLPPFFNYGDLA